MFSSCPAAASSRRITARRWYCSTEAGQEALTGPSTIRRTACALCSPWTSISAVPERPMVPSPCVRQSSGTSSGESKNRALSVRVCRERVFTRV